MSFDNAFGQMVYDGNSTAQSLTTTAAKLTGGWADAGVSNQGNDSVTVDASDGSLELRAGAYEVHFSGSGESSAAQLVTWYFAVDGVEVAGTRQSVSVSGAADEVGVSIHAIIRVTDKQKLTIEVLADAATDLTMVDCVLYAKKIG